MTRVRTTHLELRSPGSLKPSSRVPADLLLLKVSTPSPELNRFLYTAVGAAWHWHERLAWTWSRWMAWLGRPEVETWVVYRGGTPAGYFELEAQEGGSVEIAYLGMLPTFAGQGLGGYLVTQAAHRAFSMRPGVERVWLHTCTLDHPGALANYLKRGFVIFKEEEADVSLPDQTPDPWPGAERPR
jgi:ribosomal protein S18 acetylase RimI-like enzyme